MSLVDFSFDLVASDVNCPLAVEVYVDHQQLFATDHLDQLQHISYQLSEDECDHKLRIVLKNKLPAHTTIDSDGNIIKDAVIQVNNFIFNGVNIDQLVMDHAEYLHDFNGTSNLQTDQFFGVMGCNGTVYFKFSTPSYIWLLENL
jgi:hypothetical protein